MTPDTALAALGDIHPGMGEAMLTGFGMMLVLEGLFYAGFPAALKQMAQQLPQITDIWLRIFGIVAMICGIGIVWLVRQ